MKYIWEVEVQLHAYLTYPSVPIEQEAKLIPKPVWA
jgi:hypothetical protein